MIRRHRPHPTFRISHRRNTLPPPPKPNFAPAKWVFARRILLAAARRIAEGKLDLERPRQLPLGGSARGIDDPARRRRQIADCVLLFAYGFDGAFPVDVWVERALRELYFPRRRVGDKRLRHFAATHFGPHAGYAQQYLFHYMRTKMK